MPPKQINNFTTLFIEMYLKSIPYRDKIKLINSAIKLKNEIRFERPPLTPTNHKKYNNISIDTTELIQLL